ncbi:MAG TPA: DHA2 family efflux MFS transporter permease subunit [Myxococcota bacterium]|nr:DHA2 family efflux MFS transporter permease subunit [Myxococcota bacterium]
MSATTEAAPKEDLRLDFRRVMVLCAVMLAMILELIDTSIVNVALPEMMGNLGATIDEIGWVVTGYIVSNVIVIPMTPWLSNRFGRKRYTTASILLFTAASALCGLSTSLPELVFFRVLQGLGGGALISTAQTVMVESFPPSRQGLGQGLFGMGAMLGPSLGPTLGGWITDEFSWPWVFYINLPLGLLAAALCALYLENPPHERMRRAAREGSFRTLKVDWPGIALLVVGVGALQTVFERGHRLDWFASDWIVLLTSVAGAAIALFVWRELTTDEPVVDLTVLRHRNLWVGCVLGVAMGIGLFGVIFLFPVFSQTLLGWTAWQTGMAVLPGSIATAITMFVAGRLVWSTGPAPLYIAGAGIFTVALTGMMSWTHQAGWNDVVPLQIARGLAMGMMFVPLSTATLRMLPPADVPKAAGLYNLFRQLGGSFGIAVLGTMLDHRSKVHGAYLAESLSPLSPLSREREAALQAMFESKGLEPSAALDAAHRALASTLQHQAMALSFEDAYRFILIVVLTTLPLVLLLRKQPALGGQARP